MKEDIESEFKFSIKLLWHLIQIPFLPILILMKKKTFADFFQPFVDIWKFIWQAKVTAILIIINIIVFFVVFGIIMTAGAGQVVLNQPADVAEIAPTISKLFVFYASDIFKIFSIDFFSIILAGFMHGSIAHLLGNMLFLFVLGRSVERKMGAGKMLLIYFISMIISHTTSAIITLTSGMPDVGSAGASGAIAGIGAAAMLLSPLGLTFLMGIPLPHFILVWLNLFGDITGIGKEIAGETNIGHSAHLGGFFAIIPLMFILNSEDRAKMIKGLVINVIIAILFLVVVLTGAVEIGVR